MLKTIHRFPGTGRLLLAALLLLPLGLFTAGCKDQAAQKKQQAPPKYPSATLDFVAPAGKGGGWDTTIRSVAKTLADTKIVTTPIEVRNAPGSGGAVHLSKLQQTKDSADIITVYSPPILFFHLNGTSPYGFRDTTPLARLIADYAAFVVKADSPFQSIGDIMEALKKDPTSVKIGGTSARGSMDHVQFLIIAKAAGVKDLDRISYRSFQVDGATISAGERMNAALKSGFIQVISTGLSDSMEMVESGEFRVIAQTADRRIGTGKQAEIPTCKESGIDATFINWRGLFGTPQMPDYAVTFWRDALKKMQATPEWKALCEKNGWDSIYLDAPEFQKFLEKTEQEYIGVMQSIGMLKKQ